ncbi:MAG: hypothetical protein AAF772_11700, partial [Acidobacteriota bacterium]
MNDSTRLPARLQARLRAPPQREIAPQDHERLVDAARAAARAGADASLPETVTRHLAAHPDHRAPFDQLRTAFHVAQRDRAPRPAALRARLDRLAAARAPTPARAAAVVPLRARSARR